jgi:hypothetical protein
LEYTAEADIDRVEGIFLLYMSVISQNWKTCDCRRFTNEMFNEFFPTKHKDPDLMKDVTYVYRRLRDKVVTGIWECNPE